MGSFDRSKKRIQLWKKAIFHFSLCFVMGFFSGFAPSNTTSMFTTTTQAAAPYQPMRIQAVSPEPVGAADLGAGNSNRSRLMSQVTAEYPADVTDEPNTPPPSPPEEDDTGGGAAESIPRRLLIVITTTRVNDPFKGVFLRRLANTLKLVPPPLLWIVVESHLEAAETLRKTGVMYRHLVFKENFTDAAGAAETDHQRNVALNHIEHHRLDGIVHFAGLSNVYDLRFFDQIREIEVLGMWPVASVSANRKRVVMEGPVCSSSRVVGWHLKDVVNGSRGGRPPAINVSSFAFNSSILWDPERWGRPSSIPDISQDSIKFVQEVVLEDETKLRAIPSPDCSRIMLWSLYVPRTTLFLSNPSAPHPPSDQSPHRG